LRPTDGSSRRLAEREGVERTGTVGLLAEAVHAGVLDLDQADEIHEAVVEGYGYRSPLDSVSESYDSGYSLVGRIDRTGATDVSDGAPEREKRRRLGDDLTTPPATRRTGARGRRCGA
jgi:hypothetical protein